MSFSTHRRSLVSPAPLKPTFLHLAIHSLGEGE
jgi:hypothetical protein